MNYMLFQNNYIKAWNEIKKDMPKWEKLQLSLLERMSVKEMNVLPRIMFLFQAKPILLHLTNGRKKYLGL